MRVVSNSSKEAEIISRASIQILAPHQLAMSFVLTVTESELTPIDNPIRITDSISLGFRLAAAYLHTFGFGYLKKTLSEVIHEVCQSDSGFEVNSFLFSLFLFVFFSEFKIFLFLFKKIF